MSVLIISPDREHYNSLDSELKKINISVAHSKDARSGMFAAVSTLPRLIICVDGFTDLNYLECLKMLRTNVTTRNVPLIVVSHLVTQSSLLDYWLNTDGVLFLPFFKTERVVNAVQDILKAKSNFRIWQPQLGYEKILSPSNAKEGLQYLFAEKKMLSFKRHEQIIEQGSKCQCVYYIWSGQVMSFKTDKNGKDFFTSIFCIGDFFNSLPPLTDGISHQAVLATMDTELLCIPAKRYLDVINTNIDFAKGTASWTALYSQRMQQQMLNLAFGTVRQKLASVLIRLYDKSPSKLIKISRENLASLAATAKETIIRNLSEFKKEGFIDIHVSSIIIKDLPGLKAMTDPVRLY